MLWPVWTISNVVDKPVSRRSHSEQCKRYWTHNSPRLPASLRMVRRIRYIWKQVPRSLPCSSKQNGRTGDAYFFAAGTLAQRALCAAAILFRPAAEIVPFLRIAGLLRCVVVLPERRQGSGYAVPFILKSAAFLRSGTFSPFSWPLFAPWDEPGTKPYSDDANDDSH